MSKRNRRTDTHRPGAIVPAEYTYLFSYNGATSVDGWPVPSYGINCELDRRTFPKMVGPLPAGVEESDRPDYVVNGQHDPDGLCCVVGMLAAGHKLIGNTCNCTVCGTHFVYGDVWRHDPTGEHIHVGHQCARKYQLLADRSQWELDMGRRKQAAAVMAQRAQNAEERAVFLAAHPGLESALKEDHRIIRDIADRFQSYRTLSDKQIALVFKLAEEVRNPKPAERTTPAPIVEGKRQTFRGVIVSLKNQETIYGETTRMTVKVTKEDGSVWLAWGTAPAGLWADQHIGSRKGATVEVKARLKAGRDPHFAIMSRPSAKIISHGPDHDPAECPACEVLDLRPIEDATLT